MQVRGHSRPSEVVPFDSLPMVSYYYRPIITLSCLLKSTVFEIFAFEKCCDLENGLESFQVFGNVAI